MVCLSDFYLKNNLLFWVLVALHYNFVWLPSFPVDSNAANKL